MLVAERRLGPREQRLGGMDGASDGGGHLADGQAVAVPQGEDAAVDRGQRGERDLGGVDVDRRVERIDDGGNVVPQFGQRIALAPAAPPVVDELVPGRADQPTDLDAPAGVVVQRARTAATNVSAVRSSAVAGESQRRTR